MPDKGLGSGVKIGLLGLVVLGISCIAPTYTITSGLGPTISQVGTHTPAVLLLGFLPMLLVAFSYKELNSRVPDSGTTFTWVTMAFGPWVGWMAGWTLVVATVLVLANLAGVAVDFFFLLIAQIVGRPDIADLSSHAAVNIPLTLVFVAIACFVSYRGAESSKTTQRVLVALQLVALGLFSVTALVEAYHGHAFDFTPVRAGWFNAFDAGSVSTLVAGVSLSIFMFWGWDVTLTMNEETDDPEKTPGRAATITIVTIIATYCLTCVAVICWAGIGSERLGAGNPDNQESILAALAQPVMGRWSILMSIAVLCSSLSSLQSTMVSPSRTLLSMSYYDAIPPAFRAISPRFHTPSTSTITAGVVSGGFYALVRMVSTTALWDTIATLGMMICLYYGTTALACVWYFRHELLDDVSCFCYKCLFPLVGGVILLVLAAVTMTQAYDPSYGSGSSIGGVGMVFILGMGILGLGVVLMIVSSTRRREFFRGKTLPTAVSR